MKRLGSRHHLETERDRERDNYMLDMTDQCPGSRIQSLLAPRVVKNE